VAGNLIYTTAEIVIADFPQLGYLHELCDMSGYEELIIHEHDYALDLLSGLLIYRIAKFNDFED
jgi:hypothetical protein